MTKIRKITIEVFVLVCFLIATGIIFAVFTGCPAAASPDPDPVDNSVSITGISLNKSTAIIGVGSTELLIANLTPADATNTDIIWTTDDSNIASVNSEGVL